MDESRHTAASPIEPRDSGPGEPSYREPAILRYLGLLWQRRGLVLGGSLLPALLVALVLVLWPRTYTATFFYERPLSESEYNVLLRRFHSRENLDKIIGRLQEQGLTRCVRQFDQARTQQSFEKLVRFDVSPIYPKRLQTTDPCTSERISAFKTKLLSVEVWGNSPEEVAGVSAVVTDNVESVLPVYDIRVQLKETLAKLRGDAAKIEDDRFKLSLDVQKEKAKLEKFKNLEGAPGEAASGGVILQFNGDQSLDYLPMFYPARSSPSKVADLRETLSDAPKYKLYDYLPLSYQVRAVQSKIVDLQETLSNNAQKHDFYLQAMDLDHRLLAKIEESLLTYYTAPQYLGFLGEQLLACRDPVLGDYLRSYIRKTENLVLVNTRAGEKPMVYPLSKDLFKSTVLTFLLFLMTAAFAAVLLEHRQERRRARMAGGGLGMAAPDRRPG